MIRPPRTLLRLVSGTALVAFLVGAVAAGFEVLGRRWVLEFQAGPASPWSERLLAIAQTAALEGAGFGALALLLALVALPVARLVPRPASVTKGERFATAFLAGAGAFAGWTYNAALAEDALPFLARGELALLNAGGFLALLCGLLAFTWLAGRWPRAARTTPAAGMAGALLALAIANVLSLAVLRGGHGFRSPARLAAVAGILVASLLVTMVLTRLAAGSVRRLGERWSRGPLLPRAVAWGLGAGLALAVLGTAPFFRLSAAAPESSYRTLVSRGAPAGPNVVFITIDTLRADHLGCYGYDRPTSPFMDELARDGARFADPTAAAAWTKPATGTLLTGLYPSRHGALYHGSRLQLPRGERTLAEVFRQAGYVTAGFVSNPNIKRVFDFDVGFDEFFDSPVEDTVTLASIRGSYFGSILMRLLRHQFNWKYENDVRRMNQHVSAWLDVNHEHPFFLYVHYIDPHIPYSPPAEFAREFARDHPGFPLFNTRKQLVGMDLYDGEVRYVDEGLRELVGTLERYGLRENTLLVLTSDHGEEFFEHGVLGHGFSLFQPVIQVPLIMHGPGITAGTVCEEPVQILDLPATVLALAGTGIDTLGDGHSFASLLAAGSAEAAPLYFLENEFGQGEADQRSFVQKGIRAGKWKLVLTERNAYFPPGDQPYGGLALYDLVADPAERDNLAGKEELRPLLRGLKEQLEAHLAHLDETGFRDAEPASISEDILGNLRALGY